MRAPVLLNIDLGELADEDEELYALAHVANVACGGHAGDEVSMRRAIGLCAAHGTFLGAHPSYPDRQGFGRRAVTMPSADLRATIAQQCSALATIARSLGAAVAYAKPHGALYHASRDDADVAAALLAGIRDALGEQVVIIGPPRGELASGTAREHLRYAREGFADRATRPDGSLVPRGEQGAVLSDPVECAARVEAMKSRGDVDTVCVHGDSPGAVAIARAVRAVLAEGPGRP